MKKGKKFELQVEAAWKRKTVSAGPIQHNYWPVIRVCLILSVCGGLYWSAPQINRLANEGLDALSAKLMAIQEPSRLAHAQEFAQSCATKTFSIAGGPGWDKRAQTASASCLDTTGWEQITSALEKSGLGRELDHPGSSLVGIFTDPNAQRATANKIDTQMNAKLVLSANGRQVELDKMLNAQTEETQEGMHVISFDLKGMSRPEAELLPEATTEVQPIKEPARSAPIQRPVVKGVQSPPLKR